jgi:hypothetical protein
MHSTPLLGGYPNVLSFNKRLLIGRQSGVEWSVPPFWLLWVATHHATTEERPRNVANLHLVTAKTPGVCEEACRFAGPLCYDRGVKGWVDPVLSVIGAAATALLLALIARDAIGMAPGMVREDALIAASIMIAGVAGMSSRRRKQ